SVERDGHATRTCQPLDLEQRLDELLVMGLRTREGITRAAFRRETGAEPEALLGGPELQALIEEGYLLLDRNGLRASEAGQGRLDAVLAHLASRRSASTAALAS